jgi:SAM-dependent methyltransferase
MQLDPDRPVGFESRKSYACRCREGFWDAFVAGSAVLDIGYRGGLPDALAIVPGAVGIELNHIRLDDDIIESWKDWVTWGAKRAYDGLHLPVNGESVDTVYASHVLEHVDDPIACLREWFRVLRVGGTMIVAVPHAYLYERRLTVPPSRWSPEHLRSFSPATLMTMIEDALERNSYRVAALFDDDTGYDYSLPIERHPTGCLEIVCVIRKITKPQWNVEP